MATDANITDTTNRIKVHSDKTGTDESTYLLVIHFKGRDTKPYVSEGRYSDCLSHALQVAHTEGPNTVMNVAINRIIASYDPKDTAKRNVDRQFG